MCYDVQALTKLREAYAKRRAKDTTSAAQIQEELGQYEGLPPLFHSSGFSHPDLLVFTNEAPYHPRLFNWGLVPFWAKDEAKARQISNKTLNARGETIFDKPSFRAAARHRRCLVMIDGFFEHHHFNGKTIPFRISLKNDEPMVLAGLWEKCTIDGKVRHTVSIVTTRANSLMAKIHNNPKIAEPRMPVILPKEVEDQWLKPIHDQADRDLLLELLLPYREDMLDYHTVRKLRGKQAVGNKPEVLEPHPYPDFAGW